MERSYQIGLGFLVLLVSAGFVGGFIAFNTQGTGVDSGSGGCDFTLVRADGNTFSSFEDYKQSALSSGVDEEEFMNATSDSTFEVRDGLLYSKFEDGVCGSGSE